MIFCRFSSIRQKFKFFSCFSRYRHRLPQLISDHKECLNGASDENFCLNCLYISMIFPTFAPTLVRDS